MLHGWYKLLGGKQARPLLSLLAASLLLVMASGCGSVTTNGTTFTTSPAPSPTPSPTPTPFPFPTPFPTPAPSATPTPTPAPTATPAPASRFIFGTPGFESGSVQAGAIALDGSVSAVAGSPFDEGLATPSIIQILADPKSRFIYVLNVSAFAAGEVIGSPGICGFAINPTTGALTRVPGSPIVFPGDNRNQMAIDGTGRFVFEPNGFTSQGTGFNVYQIDPVTGSLTLSSATANAAPVGSFTAASADGRFLFNAGNGLVEAFAINASTGQLLIVPGTTTSTSGSAGPMVVSADSKFLYVANQTEGTVAVFAIGSNGSLTSVTGSNFAIDNGAQFITLTPDGRFLFVAAAPNNSLSQTVKGYAVNPVAGTFTPIAGAVVTNVTTVTLDRSGGFAYISGVGSLTTFAIHPVTGALTSVSQAAAPSSDDANDIVAVP
jgi:6-phosphogluconolactonase (cycloisomerase 2 family)